MHLVVLCTYWMQQGQVSHDPSSKKNARQETAFLYDAFILGWEIRRITLKSWQSVVIAMFRIDMSYKIYKS